MRQLNHDFVTACLTLHAVVFGWAGDRMKQRHSIFLFGLLSVGQHIAILLIGRFLQGLAAAIVWTSGLALLTDLFGQARYGEAIGYGQTSVSIGTTASPLLGGVVYSHGGYSAVSAMSIGVVALSLILALIMVEPKPQSDHGEYPSPHYPYPGSTHVNGSSEDVGHSSGGSNVGEPDPELPDEHTSLIPKAQKKCVSKTRPAYPILLRSGRILAAMGGIFTYAFVLNHFEGVIPLFVKETFHWDSTHAALTFLSWIIPGMLGPVAGAASDRFGSRWIAVGGFLLAAPPLILMRLVKENTMSQKFLLCSLLTLGGEYPFTSFLTDGTLQILNPPTDTLVR